MVTRIQSNKALQPRKTAESRSFANRGRVRHTRTHTHKCIVLQQKPSTVLAKMLHRSDRLGNCDVHSAISSNRAGSANSS
eukprot:3314754-Amphidinium_carterae.2